MILDSGRALAITRIAFGGYFLAQGVNKMQTGWLGSGEQLMRTTVGPALERNTVEGFYRPFLENVVQPNVGLFSALVATAEVCVGLSLLLGLLVRPGCIVALFLNLNYMLMKGLANSGGSIDRMFAVSEVVLFLGAAGLVWGLDGYLARAAPGNPLARWLAGSAEPAANRTSTSDA
jgi:thiosulfate dehydrogenase [quinone] large subunit